MQAGPRLGDHAAGDVLDNPLAQVGNQPGRPKPSEVIDRQVGHRDPRGDERIVVEAFDDSIEGNPGSAEIDHRAVDTQALIGQRIGADHIGAGDLDGLVEPLFEKDLAGPGVEIEGDIGQVRGAVERQLDSTAYRKSAGAQGFESGRLGGDPFGAQVGEIHPNLEIAPLAAIARADADFGGAAGDIDQKVCVDADAAVVTGYVYGGQRRGPGHAQAIVDDREIAPDDADALQITHRPRGVRRRQKIGEQ